MSFDTKIKLSLTCRLCANLITNSALYPLHLSIEQNKESPIIIIEKYTNHFLQIKENDYLPQQVCSNCLNKFDIINSFLTRVIEAQEHLRNYFNPGGLEENLKIELFDFDESQTTSSDLIESYENDYLDYDLSDSDSSEAYFNDNFSEDFRFMCHICNKELKSARKLDKHLTEDHNIKGDDIILCEHCGQYLSKKVYFRHIKQANFGDFFSCKYCDKKFLSKRTLCHHYDAKHSKHKTTVKKDIYPCPICKRKFKTFVYMQKHQISAHNPKREKNPRYKPNSCPYCEQIYGRSDHLQIHIKRVHLGQLDHKCNYCGKCYSQGFQLNHHIKISHCEKPVLTCEICSKKYLNLKRFKEHLSEHNEKPTFKCILCGLFFRKNTELKKHEALHDKEATNKLNINSNTGYENQNKSIEDLKQESLLSKNQIENFEIAYLNYGEDDAE